MQTITPLPQSTARPANLLSSFTPAPNESVEAFDAFLCYFELGHHRTLKLVSEQLDLSENTVREWSSKFNWRLRLRDYRTQLIGSRIQADAVVSQEQALAKSQQQVKALDLINLLGNQLLQSSQALLQHLLLSSPDKIELDQVLKMMQLGEKLLHSVRMAASADFAQDAQVAAYREKLNETAEWIYAQKQAAPPVEFIEGGGI